MTNLRDLYQQVILERNKRPKHRGQIDSPDFVQEGKIPNCGDNVTISLQMNPDRSQIQVIKFAGDGCAICLASTDLMAEKVEGRTVEQTLQLVSQFELLLLGKYQFPPELRELNAFAGISQIPARVTCAMLSWHTLRQCISCVKGEA